MLSPPLNIETDYKKWKLQRKDLINKIRHEILSYTESQIKSFYDQLIDEITKNLSSNEIPSLLYSIQRISILSYFQRNSDVINTYMIKCLAILKMNEEILIHTIMKEIEWETKKAIPNYYLIKESLNIANKWLQDKQFYFGALLILKHLRKVASAEVTTVIMNNLNDLLNYTIDENEMVRCISLKILKCVIKLKQKQKFQKITFFIDKCKIFFKSEEHEKVYSCLALLIDLLDADGFEFKPTAEEIFNKIMDKDDKIITVGLDLIFHINSKNRIDFDPNQIIFLLFKKYKIYPNLLKLIIDVIKHFKKSLNHIELIKLISEYSKDNFCETASICPFEILLQVLITFKCFPGPNLFNYKKPCKHYIECIKYNNTFITQFIKDYFKQPFQNDTEYLSNAFKLYQICPNVFKIEKQEFISNLDIIFNSYDYDFELKKDIMDTLAFINSEQSIDILLNISLSYYDKTIRMYALNLLKPSPYLSTHKCISFFLNDPSFHIRRKGIKLISKMIDYNPFEIRPMIVDYLEKLFELITSSKDAKYSAKYASFLAAITKYCQECTGFFSFNIIFIALKIINSTLPDDQRKVLSNDILKTRSRNSSSNISNLDSLSITSQFTLYNTLPSSLSSSYNLPQHENCDYNNDLVNNNLNEQFRCKNSYDIHKLSPLLLTQKQASKEPNRAKLLLLFNSKQIDKRDGYLLESLSNLGKSCQPFLTEILLGFSHIFKTRKNENLLISSVKSLIKLSIKTYNGFNIRLRCPEIIPPLIKIVSTTDNEELIISIIQLFGSAFDSIDILMNQELKEDNLLVTTEPSFFTRFVLNILLKRSQETSLLLLKTISMIFESDPQNSRQYLPKILPVFTDFIEKSGANYCTEAFHYFETIAKFSQNDFIPLLPKLQPLLLKLIEYNSCIEFCICLSYYFKNEFIANANEIYFSALNHLSSKDYNYFKSIVKMIVSLSVYQHQPLDVFLKSLDLLDLQPRFMKYIIKALTAIIQYCDITMHTGHLVIFGMQVYKKYKLDITSYFASLAICSESQSFFKFDQFLKFNNIEYKHLNELNNVLAKNVHSIKDAPFLKDLAPTFKLERISPTFQKQNDFFINLKFPNESQTTKFFNNLFDLVIKNSPSSPIRLCTEYISTRPTIKYSLFSAAFLSCWKNATNKDKDHFSEIVNRILFEHKNIKKLFIDLVQLTSRALLPMNLDYIKVAEISESKQFSLFILQKLYIQDPTNFKVTLLLMNICLKMGRISIVRSLFNKVENQMSKLDIAKWSGAIGDWERALKIYQSEDNQFPEIINCLYMLNRYEDIEDLEYKYRELSHEDQGKVYEYFLWTFAYMRENRKVNEIIKSFTYWTIPRFHFVIYYSILVGDYDRAQELINMAFQYAAKMRSNYSSIDQLQIEEGQNNTQILIESQEVLNYKLNKTPSDQIESFWKKRVKYFQRSKRNWEKTILLRELVIPPYVNISYYIPIISQLRKSKLFSLIDFYFMKHLNYSSDPQVLIEKIKIIWAKGEKINAFNAIHYNYSIFFLETPDEFKNLNENYPNPFICSLLDKLSKTPNFSEELQDYCLLYYNSQSLPNFLSTFEGQTISQQNSFFSTILKHFPSQIFSCVKQYINNGRFDTTFFSQLYALYGKFLVVEKSDDFQSLKNASYYFKESLDLNPNKKLIWRKWSYVNTMLFSYSRKNCDFNNANNYATNALSGFFKLLSLQPENDLEYFSQILSVFCNTCEKVCTKFKDRLLAIPKSSILKLLPQLTMKIAHHDILIRNIIIQLLNETGNENFQQVYFALYPYINDDGEQSINAREISSKIKQQHLNEAEDADLFINGMIHCAITWFEQWMHSLEIAVSEQRSGNTANVDYILNERFNDFENPHCELDYLFVRLYQDIIDEASGLFEQGDPKSIQQMWDKLKSLYSSIKERVNMLSVIFVNKISPELTNKRNFSLYIPGYNDGILYSIEPVMDVLETQQHPRCVYFISDDGLRHKFLLKGNEDLRLDERLMQFFALINGILPKNLSTEQDISVSRYEIVPMTKNVGLIKWFKGADTIHQLICKNRDRHNIEKNIESIRVSKMISSDVSLLTLAQKYEIFTEISKEFKGLELFESMWLNAPNAAVWLARTQKYTISYALMAMVGYIIGLGDRHPSNIMIQRETGKVVHIDFGDSFDSATLRPVFPEKVPFRLTRMIVNCLEGSTSSGYFKDICIKVMQVIRDNNSLLLNHLAIFVEETNDDFEKGNSSKRDPHLLDRCENKLFGREFYSQEISVKDQVEVLIDIAENPFNYLQHYPGWCPYW